MTDPNKISTSIKSGKYFSEGIDWYKEMFVYPLRHSSVMALFCLVLTVVLVIMSLYIYLSLPLEEKVQVIVPMRDSINFISRITSARKEGTSIKQVIVDDLVTKYISARESFIPGRFETNYAFILNSSSKDIFDVYYKLLLIPQEKNPDGSVKSRPEVRIHVSNISQNISQENDNKVTVMFSKNTYDRDTRIRTVSKWKADIEFYLSDYNFEEANTSILDFIVTKYDTSEIKQKTNQ